MIAYIFASFGFAAILYGISPLAGSRMLDGYVSEHGTVSALLGIGALTIVTTVKVLS